MKLAYLLLIPLLVFGCSGEATGPAIEVDFSWPADMTPCFDTKSPEIRLKSIPEGTRSFSVKVFDTEYAMNHGGGKVMNDGTGFIAEGALKEYKGPCYDLAISGPGNYEFTITAMDDKGKAIASGKTARKYPEK